MGPKHGIRKVHVSCNTCGSAESTRVASGRDHEYATTTDDEFFFVRCNRCGHMYLNPRPDVSELDVIYPPDYYSYILTNERSKARGASSTWMKRVMFARAVERCRPLAERIAATPKDLYRILDIGCGDGAILDAWKAAFDGRKIETHGIEMAAKAAEIARTRGHIVHTQRLEDATLPERSFDFVYSSHVIEHVEDPTSFMAKARTTIASDGLLMIETPSTQGLDASVFRGGHWGGYHFPRHWNLYDPETFTTLAKKTGFDVLDITFLPCNTFWIWTLHSIVHARSPALADRVFPPVEVMYRGTPWNVFLLAFFNGVDRVLIRTLGRCSQMRILMRPARTSPSASSASTR